MPNYITTPASKGDQTEFWERESDDATEMVRVAVVQASMADNFLKFLVQQRGIVRPGQGVSVSEPVSEKKGPKPGKPKAASKKAPAKKASPPAPAVIKTKSRPTSTDPFWSDQDVDSFVVQVMKVGEEIPLSQLHDRINAAAGHVIGDQLLRLRLQQSKVMTRVPAPHPLPEGVAASTQWFYRRTI